MDYNYIYNVLQYSFRDAELLCLALIHPSIKGSKNYERLEFLGDSLLGFIISEYLYTNNINDSEAQLSIQKSYLVSRKICSCVAHDINIGSFIKMSSGENKNGGRSVSSNLANVMESIIGAIFLDGGIDETKRVIINLWSPYLSHKNVKNYKTVLQEWTQLHYNTLPTYKTIESKGLEHDLVFKIELSVDKHIYYGYGKSKKDAELNAAKNMIDDNGIK